MHQYMAEIWTKMWKTNSEELKEKAMTWRKEPTIHRIERPSRLDRAHRLGYKAKQGIVVIRTKVGIVGIIFLGITSAYGTIKADIEFTVVRTKR
jgi:large subunit ribosomal protein L15e